MNNIHYEIPLSLSRQLSENNDALQNYSVMTYQQKENVNRKVRQCVNCSEVNRIVQNIADGQFDS